jgi:putative endonuclease
VQGHQRHPLTPTFKDVIALFSPDKPPRPAKRSAAPTADQQAKIPTPRSTSADVARARQLSGTQAEDAAANYFEHIGYSILARNLHVGRAEIDLLVQEDDVIVIVEVRTRGSGSYQRALDSITPSKCRRLRKAGEVLWRRRFLKDKRISRMRFDAVAVTFDENDKPVVEHIRAAF